MNPSVSTYVSRGIWYVNVYWAGPPAQRKRVSLNVPADEDPAEAVAMWRATVLPALVEAATAATPKPPGRAVGVLLRDIATWYLDTHLPYIGSKPKTIEYYRSTLWNFIGWCSTRHVARTGQLSARIVEEWQMSTRAKPSREQVVQVRRWLRVAEEHDQIPELPPMKWVIPKKNKATQHRAHEPAVIEAWLVALEAFRPHVGLLARWVAATGWRIGDAIDLRVGEVDLSRGTIQRQQLKTSSALPYPITPALRLLLERALRRHTKPAPADHVFLSHKRQPWAYPQVLRVLVSFDNRYPVHITFRDLRKSFGTHLAMAGCPPNVLKELMGHSDITMTLGYYVDVDMARMAEWSEKYTAPVSASVSTEE
jgi:integrase